MNLIKSLYEMHIADWRVKKSLTASRNDDSCNKERKAQDVGDEEIMYEPLLDDIDAETLTKTILKLTRDRATSCKA